MVTAGSSVGLFLFARKLEKKDVDKNKPIAKGNRFFIF